MRLLYSKFKGIPWVARERDKKALYLIYQALDDDEFEKISNATTTKEMWDRVQTSYKRVEPMEKEGLSSNS